MTTAYTQLVLLLGQPVRHSLSPQMMTRAFADLQLNAVYVACEVPDHSLETALNGMRAMGIRGANITRPHKQRAAMLCNTLDATARLSNAVNTVVVHADGLHGLNTDAAGAIHALHDASIATRGANVVVLGTGGAARAVCAGLVQAHAREVVLVSHSRSVQQTHDLVDAARALTPETIVRVLHATKDLADVDRALCVADGVVHATPVGTQNETADPNTWTHALLSVRDDAWVMDVVYRPRWTPWLLAARTRGLRVVDGCGMLAWQGALAVNAWFETRAEGHQFRRYLDAEETLG